MLVRLLLLLLSTTACNQRVSLSFRRKNRNYGRVDHGQGDRRVHQHGFLYCRCFVDVLFSAIDDTRTPVLGKEMKGKRWGCRQTGFLDRWDD